MFSCPIPNYACEPILAFKQGKPILFWEALFRGMKAPDANWNAVDQKLFEFLANNSPPEKWKRRLLAVNLSTDSVFGINDDLIKRLRLTGLCAWNGQRIMQQILNYI